MHQEHERRLSRVRGEQALEHARAAAELYMQVAERAALQERKLLVTKIKELIDRAEFLKRSSADPATTRRPSLPISTRERTRTEEIVVLRASRLHGNTFPPWKDPPDEEFSRASCPEGIYMCVEECYLDQQDPHLLTSNVCSVMTRRLLFPMNNRRYSLAGVVQLSWYLAPKMEASKRTLNSLWRPIPI